MQKNNRIITWLLTCFCSLLLACYCLLLAWLNNCLFYEPPITKNICFLHTIQWFCWQFFDEKSPRPKVVMQCRNQLIFLIFFCGMSGSRWHSFINIFHISRCAPLRMMHNSKFASHCFAYIRMTVDNNFQFASHINGMIVVQPFLNIHVYDGNQSSIW